MSSKVLISGVVGGIIVFVWSAVSWMLLPVHMSTLHNFQDEKIVAEVIQANATVSGVYVMPKMHQNGASPSQAQMQGPKIFAAVQLGQIDATMTRSLIMSLLTQMAAALLVAYMLMRTDLQLGYFGRLGFVMVFALAAGIVTEVPYMTWFGFDYQYTLVQMADLLISWFFAGLVLAGICRR